MRSLEFDPAGFEDFAWWVQHDRKKALRLLRLIEETQKEPFKGIGKPEPLKHELAGCWSRRIDDEHRLVYQVTDAKIPHSRLPLSLLTSPAAVVVSIWLDSPSKLKPIEPGVVIRPRFHRATPRFAVDQHSPIQISIAS